MSMYFMCPRIRTLYAWAYNATKLLARPVVGTDDYRSRVEGTGGNGDWGMWSTYTYVHIYPCNEQVYALICVAWGSASKHTNIYF